MNIPKLIIFTLIVGFTYLMAVAIQAFMKHPSLEMAMIQAVGIGLFWAIENRNK